MQDKRLVSIIMPAFNAEKTIGDAIQSVLDQTYSNWELIIVDDGSTDDTFRVIQQFMDSRIKATQRSNHGVAASRNYALSIAEGQYIAFLDSDDLWFSEKLVHQLAAFQNPGSSVGLIHTNYLEFDDQGMYAPKPLKHLFGLKIEGQVHADLMVHDFIATLTVMVTREAIAAVGMFREDFYGTEDWDLWIRIAEHFTVKYLPTQLGKYRLVNGSLSKNYDKYEQELQKVLDSHLEKKHTSSAHLHLGRWLFHKHMAHGFARSENFKKAFFHWKKAFAAKPLELKNILSLLYLLWHRMRS